MAVSLAFSEASRETSPPLKNTDTFSSPQPDRPPTADQEGENTTAVPASRNAVKAKRIAHALFRKYRRIVQKIIGSRHIHAVETFPNQPAMSLTSSICRKQRSGSDATYSGLRDCSAAKGHFRPLRRNSLHTVSSSRSMRGLESVGCVMCSSSAARAVPSSCARARKYRRTRTAPSRSPFTVGRRECLDSSIISDGFRFPPGKSIVSQYVYKA